MPTLKEKRKKFDYIFKEKKKVRQEESLTAKICKRKKVGNLNFLKRKVWLVELFVVKLFSLIPEIIPVFNAGQSGFNITSKDLELCYEVLNIGDILFEITFFCPLNESFLNFGKYKFNCRKRSKLFCSLFSQRIN